MFLAPWFLAGLLGIAVPIWLHRIARRERVKVPFASLMLLAASEVRDTSRRTLRYWLLLALRIALLILLALAFAQPLLKSDSDALSQPQSQLHAIVLDTSLSMQYGGRWQRAVKQAQALIDNVSGGDRAMLVAASGRKVELVAGPVLASDADVLRAALATIAPTLERLDYGMLMSSSSAWLSANGLPTQVHLITDLQQSASPLRFADLAPPANARVQVHDISASGADSASAPNAAIVHADMENAKQSSAEGRLFTATVRGSAADKTLREMVLTIDNQTLPAKRVVFDRSDTAQVVFQTPKLRAGTHKLRFELQPHDALPQDDIYYAVIEHTEPSVLLIAHDLEADEAAYLASAIESQSAMHLTVVRATPQTLPKILAARPLSDFSAVFVTDSGILSDAQARQLVRYVDAGGAMLATLGPQAAQLNAEPITGMALRKVTDESRVAAVDDSHPVLRDASGWQAVRFMKHLALRMADHDRALITLGDRSPLLIERNAAGRLLLLTAPLDRSWNDLPIHPLFVRFIADAAHYLTDRAANAMAYPIGARIPTGITAGTGGQIFDPEGKRVLMLGKEEEASHLTPTQAGFYEVRSGQEKHWLAVNPDARESDLTAMPADSLARWQALAADAAAASAPQASMDGANTNIKVNAEHSIGWQLLIAAAFVLLLELLLANYRLTIRRDGTTAKMVGAKPISTEVS